MADQDITANLLAKLSPAPPKFDVDRSVELQSEIWGWRVLSDRLHNLGLSEPPSGYTWVVGAISHEWIQQRCESSQIYLLPNDSFLRDTEYYCLEQTVAAYSINPSALQFVSGFQPVIEYSSQIESARKHQSDAEHTNDNLLPNHGIDPTIDDVELTASLAAAPSLSRAFSLYTDSCVCGRRYSDNCAHFLSNALIRAGYSFGSGYAKCRSGRPIRAKELLRWAQRRPSRVFKSNHNNPLITSGYWFVYQESSNGQGHVLLHKESPDSYDDRGTGDYDDWPVQWHYKF